MKLKVVAQGAANTNANNFDHVFPTEKKKKKELIRHGLR